jgi:hypothetical protein
VKFRALALMTAIASVSLPNAAFAFDPDKSADVLSRPRPEFDARGVRLGSFMLFPTLTAGLGYEDNVFEVNNASGPQEDFLFTLAPELRLNSDWGRHALNFYAGSKSYFYQDFSDEDRTDWQVGGDARLDIFGGTSLALNGIYEEVTEPRGTDPQLLTFDQTEYSHWGVGASLNHASGRFRGTLGVSYDEFDYDDVTNAVANAVPAVFTAFCPTGLAAGQFRTCNNDDRDVAVLESSLKLGYSVSPGYAVFVRGKLNERDFNSANPSFGGQEVDDAGFNRDSSGWGADLGLDFEVSRLLHGEAYVGYSEQDYDSVALNDTDAFTFGVDLQWYATMLTTVTLNASRDIRDAVDASSMAGGASGFISDKFGVRVDHELMRNVVLFGKVGFGQDEYQQSLREDDIFHGGLGAIFLVNNNLHLTASYDFIDRDSNVALFDYSNNAFTLSLTGKL